MLSFTVLLFQDPNEPKGWLGAVPAISAAHSEGETREEALAMTKEALELILALMLEDHEAIPDDLLDFEAAKVGWCELLQAQDIIFESQRVFVRAEVMAVAA